MSMVHRNGFECFSAGEDGFGCYKWSWPVLEAILEELRNTKEIIPRSHGLSFSEYVSLRTVMYTVNDWPMHSTMDIINVASERGFKGSTIDALFEEYPGPRLLHFRQEPHKTLKWMVRDLARVVLWAEVLRYLLKFGLDKKYTNR